MLKAFRVPISWTEIFQRTAREVQADNCLGLAAELASRDVAIALQTHPRLKPITKAI